MANKLRKGVTVARVESRLQKLKRRITKMYIEAQYLEQFLRHMKGEPNALPTGPEKSGTESQPPASY